MRIGFISTESEAGGATRAMRRTIAALEAAGHEAVVIATTGADAGRVTPEVRALDHTAPRPARIAGVAHYFYNGRYVDRNRTSLSNTLFWVPAVGLDLADVVTQMSVDVINVHWTSYFASLKSIEGLMRLPTPVVFTLHDMAHLTGGCHYSAGCRRFESDCRPCPQLRHDPFHVPRDVRERRGEAYAAGRPWAIAPSRWMTDMAEASGLFEPGRTAHIVNALDAGVFSPRSRRVARGAFGIPADARVILFGAVDNGEHRKGFDLLSAAMRRLLEDGLADDGPPVVVLGFGANPPALDLPGVRVMETGYIDDDARLAQAYSAADVTVIPSREDNLPNVMMESLSCGAPVAGFAIGGIAEVVEDGVNGALAEPGDVAGLADAIRRVLLNPSGTDMRRGARRSAQLLASEPVHARRYIEVFTAARAAAGFGAPEGQPPRPPGWRPSSPRMRPTMAEFFGGPAAEAAIRVRAMLP